MQASWREFASRCLDAARAQLAARARGIKSPHLYTPGLDGHVSQIKETPVTVVAGVGYLGAQSAKAIRAAVALPDFVTEGLKRAEATLYGSESCSWTVRQKTVFGPAFETVNYVECNREPAKCSAAGVSSVPAWHLAKAGPDSTPRKLVGFQPLPALLQATAARFSEAELKEFTERD